MCLHPVDRKQPRKAQAPHTLEAAEANPLWALKYRQREDEATKAAVGPR